MADSEIQEEAKNQSEQKGSSLKFWKKKEKKSKKKKEKPDDAVRTGCGGLFRRKKRDTKDAPVEKPRKPKSVQGDVQMEQGPQTEMWSNIVSNSLIGTGVFTKAAVCSLESGGIFACKPQEFTPTVQQVRELSNNFSNRSVFSAAGFGVADCVYELQEETGNNQVMSGANSQQSEGVLITKSNTALLLCVYTEKLTTAMQLLNEMRDHFVSQGL